MDANKITEKLQGRFGADCIQVDEKAKRGGVLVSVENLVDIMRFLRDDPELAMDFLNCVSGIDLLDLAGAESDNLRSLYHLYSYAQRHEFSVSVDIPRDDPRVPSMTSLWASAIWMEREAYDLLGIIYENHPGLTRLLLPTEFEGHPLRKDWKEGEFVMGISTTRDTPIDLLKFFHDKMGGEVPPGLTTDLNPPTAEGNAPNPESTPSSDTAPEVK